MQWGIAASLLLGVTSLFMQINDNSVPEIMPVASVALRSGENITVTTTTTGSYQVSNSMLSLNTGDILSTGQNSRLALQWNSGGSLRINANTTLEFISPQAIQLISGTVYFDSESSGKVPDQPAVLSIITPAGSASHIGTQFMTQVMGNNVTISVREGRVKIEGRKSRLFVNAGNRMDVNANGATSRKQIAPYGETWGWVENIAPGFDPDGRPVSDLLNWIGRETGRSIHYRSMAAEQEAGEVLHGFKDLHPVDALEVLSSATDLGYRFIDGRIEIRMVE